MDAEKQTFSEKDLRDFSDALADVQCWFRGFRAAHAMSENAPDYPPGLDRLLDLKIKLDRM